MLNRQPQPEDPTASKDSDTESSDYESADEDLCLASSGGEQPRSDGKALTRESPPQAASSCSYGRLGIIAHVVKGLQRSSKADESTTPESVTTPTHSDATLAAELEPQPPDTTIRWEDPATGKVHYLDKRNVVCNINTGEMYLLPSASGGHATVQELSSGQSISFDEFESKLGLQAESNGHRRSSSNDTVDSHGEHSSLTRKIKRLASRLKTSKAFSIPGSPMGISMRSSSQSVTAEVIPVSPTSHAVHPVQLPSSAVQVKVSVQKKMYKELADLYMIQEVHGHRPGSVIWSMRFSPNGTYLATAGQDCEVVVWQVVRTHTNSNSPEGGGGAGDGTTTTATKGGGDAGHVGGQAPEGGPGSLSSSGAPKTPRDGGSVGSPQSEKNEGGHDAAGSPLLDATPFRRYKGHTADVLDVCWSKKGLFLLSASMDHTVRLWHISLDTCLSVFTHSDYVTSIDFHPINEHFFLSGSMDGKVRIWNIPGNKVADYSDVHDMVTAVTFSPDGRKAVVGTMKGKCRFYTCEQDFKLEYEAQIGVKNRNSKHAGGKKITGLQFMPGHPNRLLITTNDSRLRLYDSYSLVCKYKGLCNVDSQPPLGTKSRPPTQIKACFSSDGVYILCGSDNGSVYMWRTCNACSPTKDGKNNNSLSKLIKNKNSSAESFAAFPKTTTVAIFGPEGVLPLAATQPQREAWLQESSRGAHKWRTAAECSEQLSAAESAMCQARAMGRLIVTAGYSGSIKVFENVGLPHWL